METRALRFYGVADLRLESVRLPDLGSGEVVVEVEACGVCGSDLHFLDGTARTGRAPITLGHEIAGIVIASRHASWEAGALVAVAAGVTDGRCRACLDDRETLCERLQMVGIDLDGGLADRIVLPGSALIRRPPGLDVAAAAVAVDAGATAYHAVVCRAGIREGDAVLIMGAGGLGSLATELAKLFGAAPVIAADRDPSALERASKLGADETILVEPGQSLGRAVKSMTDGGVDVALEFVGRAATVDAAVKSLRPGGAAIVAGIGQEPLTTIPPVLWASHEYALVGSFGSHRRDAQRVLELLGEGAVQGPPIEIVSLEDARLRVLAAASGKRPPAGRMVVVP